VCGDVAGVAAADLAGCVTEDVPHGRPSAVFADGSFDLVGGGRRSPQEVAGESRVRVHSPESIWERSHEEGPYPRVILIALKDSAPSGRRSGGPAGGPPESSSAQAEARGSRCVSRMTTACLSATPLIRATSSCTI